MDALLAAADGAAPSVNLGGALGRAVARGDSPAGRLTPAVGWKFGSKIAAAAIVMIAAALVLALDENRSAFTSLTIAFLAFVAIGLFVLVRHANAVDEMTPPGG